MWSLRNALLWRLNETFKELSCWTTVCLNVNAAQQNCLNVNVVKTTMKTSNILVSSNLKVSIRRMRRTILSPSSFALWWHTYKLIASLQYPNANGKGLKLDLLGLSTRFIIVLSHFLKCNTFRLQPSTPCFCILFFQRAWSRPVVLSENEIRKIWSFLTIINRKDWEKLCKGSLHSYLPWSITHCRQNHILVWGDSRSSSDLRIFARNWYLWPWEALVAVTVILAILAEGHTNLGCFSLGHAVC